MGHVQAPHTLLPQGPRAPKAWWPAGAGSWSCPCWATVAGAGPAASTSPLLGHVPCAGLQSRAGSWASEPACRPCVPHAHVGRCRRDPHVGRTRTCATPGHAVARQETPSSQEKKSSTFLFQHFQYFISLILIFYLHSFNILKTKC